jgi:predicted ATPase
MAPEASNRVLAQTFAAVRELALGLGGLQERLEGACDAMLSLESKEIPEPLREEFLALIGAVMDIEELTALTDTAAVTLAQRILAFHERVIRSL